MKRQSKTDNRAARVARIKYAESLGYVRWEPYKKYLGLKKPRWHFEGTHYDFDELPYPPVSLGDYP